MLLLFFVEEQMELFNLVAGIIKPNKPDLSHLTPEERAIIEDVMHRQHREENKEYEFLR